MEGVFDVSIPGLFMIVGPQGYGKSHLIKYIIHSYAKVHKRLKYGIVFSNTGFDHDDNFEYIPKKFIHSSYNEKKLMALMAIQRNQPKAKRKMAFVIFDDIMRDSQFKSKPFVELCTQLRHYHIFVILSVQYCVACESLFRSQVYQAAIFKCDDHNSLTALFKAYGQTFARYQDFKEYVLSNLGDYKFLFINRREMDVRKQITLKRAPAEIPKFKLRYGS